MNSQRDDWSVWPWFRDDADEPDRIRRVRLSDGKMHDVLEALDPAWIAKHRRYGASIHDHDREVTYEATVDERGRLDYLRVTFDNGRLIDENVMRRVPVATIRRTVLDFERKRAAAEAEHGGQVLVLVFPGGLRERPTLQEVVELMRDGYDRPAMHALYPNVNKRTVDGWMTRARRLTNSEGEGLSGTEEGTSND